MRKSTTIGLGIGCAVGGISCTFTAIYLLIFGGAFLGWLWQTPEEVVIRVHAPTLVTKGDQVIIFVEVENTGTEPQLLHSVDVSSNYLSGIAIQGADPPFTESYKIPMGPDMLSYTFERPIAPGGTTTVQFFGTAVGTGDFSGDIDVCVKSAILCETFLTRTIVDP
jgi:hypothetical protein